MPQTELAFRIPSAKVGLVIGKGGETIKKISNNNGVRMSINDDEVRIVGEKASVQKAKWQVEAIVQDKSRGGGRGGGKGGRDWAEYKKKLEPSVEKLQGLKPTKVHLGKDSLLMVMNLLRELATGEDAEAAIAVTADIDSDDDSEEARAARYKAVKAQEKLDKANAKVLKKMTKQDKAGDGWKGTDKGKIFGVADKLGPTVRLKVCFDKNPQQQCLLPLVRSKGLKGLLTGAKGKLKMKKAVHSAYVAGHGDNVTLGDSEILAILDDVVVTVSAEKVKAKGKEKHEKKSKKSKKTSKSTSAVKAPPLAPAPPAPAPAPVKESKPHPTVKPAAAAAELVAGSIKVAALEAFYAKYCPEKLERVGLMLQKFTPAQIVAALRKKYGSKDGCEAELRGLVVTDEEAAEAAEARVKEDSARKAAEAEAASALAAGGGSGGSGGGSGGWGSSWADEDEEEEAELERRRASQLQQRCEDEEARGRLSGEAEVQAEERVRQAVVGTPQQQKLPMRMGGHSMRLLQMLHRQQVVVLAGETGCGKTTQAPQMLLEAWEAGGFSGSGSALNIVCTQPRRISAVTVAERVAEERSERVGESVGYQVRLQRKVSRTTRLTYCTTGILLRRMQGDPMLRGVTHLVLDEVHERDSLTDFLLVLVKQLLPVRPDLRVLLMSATLDIDLFAGYFALPSAPASASSHTHAPDADGCNASDTDSVATTSTTVSDTTAAGTTPAPHLAVPGRTFPVQPYFMEDAVEATGYEPSQAVLRGRASAARRQQQSQESFDEAKGGSEKRADEERQAREEREREDLSALQGPVTVAQYRSQTMHTVSALEQADGAIDLGLIENTLALLCDGGSNGGGGGKGGRGGRGGEGRAGADAAPLVRLRGMLVDGSGSGSLAAGSALVFLPGAYEIAECARTLRSSGRFPPARFEILTLHSSVPPREQKKAFLPAPQGKVKIVLATNIAETSVTIPDCVVVLDSGRVKETRFDPGRGMVRLQEGWCSRASSKQRKELLRVPLDSIVLQLKSMPSDLHQNTSLCPPDCSDPDLDPGIEPRQFLARALEPPPAAQVEAAIDELRAIGALTTSSTSASHAHVQGEGEGEGKGADTEGAGAGCGTGGEQLTPLGRLLAKLPLPPRLGKMLVLSCIFGCAGPCLTIAAALSLQSPFISPSPSAPKNEKQKAARARLALATQHYGRKRGTNEGSSGGGSGGSSSSRSEGGGEGGGSPPSDHLAVLAAYEGWCAELDGAGGKGERGFCAHNWLSSQTMRQIRATREQLASQLADIGLYHLKRDDEAEHWRGEEEGRSSTGCGDGDENGDGDGDDNFAARHEGSAALVKCLLCAALIVIVSFDVLASMRGIHDLIHGRHIGIDPQYPNVVRVVRYKQPRAKGWSTKVIGKEGEVKVHPASVLHPPSQYTAEWLVYLERVETSQVFVRDATAVSAYPLMLCGGGIEVLHDKGVTTVDGWMQFEVENQVGVLFKALKEELNAVLLSLLDSGTSSERAEAGEKGGDPQVDWRKAKGRKVVDAVVVLLEAEEREQRARV